jgi:hypothetical protein
MATLTAVIPASADPRVLIALRPGVSHHLAASEYEASARLDLG